MLIWQWLLVGHYEIAIDYGKLLSFLVIKILIKRRGRSKEN